MIFNFVNVLFFGAIMGTAYWLGTQDSQRPTPVSTAGMAGRVIYGLAILHLLISGVHLAAYMEGYEKCHEARMEELP